MKQPVNSGFRAEEAAAALNMSGAEFIIAVAAGKLPQPIGRDSSGHARWDGVALGRIARERFGPVTLHGLVSALDRMNKGQS